MTVEYGYGINCLCMSSGWFLFLDFNFSIIAMAHTDSYRTLEVRKYPH